MDSDTTQLSLRIPRDLRERLEQQAAAEERTASQFIRYHLAEILKEAETEKREAQPA